MNSIQILKFIVSLSASSVTAGEILGYFSSRQRDRQVEPVRRLKRICSNGTTRQAVINVLRQLEAHGFGTFKAGRRGHESRFIWKEV
jgi:hypothetical protein